MTLYTLKSRQGAKANQAFKTCSMLVINFFKDRRGFIISRSRGEIHFARKHLRHCVTLVRDSCTHALSRRSRQSGCLKFSRAFTRRKLQRRQRRIILPSFGAVLWIRLHGWSLVCSKFHSFYAYLIRSISVKWFISLFSGSMRTL